MVITSKEVRIIDSNCSELGIAVLQLMENAGSAAAKIILEKYPAAENIVICCGKGNNGGDGFVTARHLTSLGRKVTVILIGNKNEIGSPEARANFNILSEMQFSIRLLVIDDSSNIIELKGILQKADLIVDALLGVGITKEPYEPIKSAIKVINNSGKPIVSIDLPSGMWSDISNDTKHMVKCDLVITFHDTKPCLTIDQLKEKVIVAEIGVPPEAEIFVGKGELKYSIPKRRIDSHKGENGTVLVVGGSEKYSGAPILASRAALRTGADLVITCIPEVIAEAVRSDSPNIIVREFEGEYFNKEHNDEILEIFDKFDSMVIGPGIGEHDETISMVLDLIERCPAEKPIIVDADALKALKQKLTLAKQKKILVTPHAGEFKILFNTAPPIDLLERKEFVKKIAKEHSLTILLKGKYDIISDGIKSKINRTGHEGMTTGGTGDVLAGILGEISAINKDTFYSACSSAYLAGKAGEFAAEDFGNSLLATDVIEKIAEVLLLYTK
ncbi:MAG: NAD(P)H-hydrate dehydratase [Candidatus Thorarchaeota archaeon]